METETEVEVENLIEAEPGMEAQVEMQGMHGHSNLVSCDQTH